MSDEKKPARKKQNKKAQTLAGRLYAVMGVLSMLELLTFLGVFLFGGEFAYIKQYAINSFVEKNANRKNYVENLFVGQTNGVYSTAERINSLINGIYDEEGACAADIGKDKELDRRILSEASPLIIELLRHNQVNDAFIILDSGELYSTENSEKKCGIYIRDMDPSQGGSGSNADLLMELGNSDIAKSLGIVLDYEWTAALDVSDRTSGRYDFFYRTVIGARNSEKKDIYELGLWTGFSGISQSANGSVKFTVPLIDKNGEVYGVVGVGMTEKLISNVLPSADSFTDENSCYILAADFDNTGKYDILMHRGSMYSRLVDENTRISREHRIEGDLYDFNCDSKIDSVGNIQDMNIYNSSSVYRSQKWALVAVGSRNSIMAIYYGLLKTFAISAGVTYVISLIGGRIINDRTSGPVTRMMDSINRQIAADSEKDVRLESSNIVEIDALGSSIIKLQANVKENSSRVSRIISMADMGLGVFMYGIENKKVFLSESLITLLEFGSLSGGSDAVISFSEFEKLLSKIDIGKRVCSDPIFSDGEHAEADGGEPEKTDIELMERSADGAEKWIKFSLTRDKNFVLGLVQDITAVVLEKRRIEYERDFDITTGLLNRRAYLSRVGKLFDDADKLRVAAVIMIDLDNLKYVNDTYGHDFGDDYIRAAANVFRKFMDYGGIVSRMSGDEFNIFLYGFESKEEIRAVIRNVSALLAKSSCMLADGSNFRIRASGGVAWYPFDSDILDRLIKFADFAMYTIKHSTKGTIAEFDRSTYDKDSILMTGVEEMNRIIDEERIKFAFQTIVSAKTGEIYGYETLMRPQSDILKTPLDLIKLAKSGSKLYEIERLTWLNGLKAFRERLESGMFPEGSKIFINSLSNCLINDIDISLIEKEYEPILKNIMLEVLEGEKENEAYMAKKQELVKSWGAMIGLDDFGSGYNSELSFIKLSPDLIKIDRSIICSCDEDNGKVSIIASLIRMAKSKNSLVLAEGVETVGELRTVIECGVDLIQGFYISYPQFDPVPVNPAVRNEIKKINSIINK